MGDEKNIFGVGEFGGSFGSANNTDVKTLISDIMIMSGISPNNERYRGVALAFMNEVQLTILKGRHWKFMNKELFRETFAPITKGAVDTEEGIHTVKHTEELFDGKAIVSAPFDVNHLGQLFHLRQSTEFYRIIEVLGQDKLMLHSGIASADGKAQGFRILNDRMKLDAKVQAVRSLAIVGQREIKPCGIQELRVKKSFNATLTGVPELFTVIASEPEDGSLTIEFFPSPDKRYSIHMEYTERPMRLADSETCYLAIPPEHVDVVTLAVRARIYQDQNNVPMAKALGAEAASAWNRMAGDQEMTDSFARLKPGRNYFQRNRNYRGYYGFKHFGKIDD